MHQQKRHLPLRLLVTLFLSRSCLVLAQRRYVMVMPKVAKVQETEPFARNRNTDNFLHEKMAGSFSHQKLTSSEIEMFSPSQKKILVFKNVKCLRSLLNLTHVHVNDKKKRSKGCRTEALVHWEILAQHTERTKAPNKSKVTTFEREIWPQRPSMLL